MNRQHFTAFLWLRWRILVNQVKRAGKANAIVTAIFAALGLVLSLSFFIGGVTLGAFGISHIPAIARLYVWVGLIAFFLFFWLIGLLTALQRSEVFSLDKFMHLPVSPSGAFLINYLGSFLSVSLILFVPGMVGLATGEMFSVGPVMLLAFPLLAAFVFASTALTYQFQGWLASLVSNPRRKRTIIVLMTAGFVLLLQLPNMLNFMRPWEKVHVQPPSIQNEQVQKLQQKYQAGEIDGRQYLQQKKVLDQEALERKIEENQRDFTQAESTTRLVCGILPPGWVALGMTDLAEGHVLLALVGTLGLGLIGSLSLLRAYRTTILMYSQGGSVEIAKPRAETPAAPADPRPLFMERKLPLVSEYASGVALAGFRSFLRAPEVKMLLLTPFIMLIVFGGGFASTAGKIPPAYAPFIVFGILGMVLVSMMQFATNIFGFDRDGFRVFVLSPIPRREILLGKNLAAAPLIFPIGFITIILTGIILHLPWDLWGSEFFQFLSMYLFFSLLGNICSIYAPFIVPYGSLRGARPSLTVILAQFGFMCVSPCVIGLPAMLPTGIEVALSELGIVKELPISMIISVVFFAGSLWLYNRLITWEGQLLAMREQKILDSVIKKSE